MRRILFSLLAISIIVGQLFLITDLQVFSFSGEAGASSGSRALSLPPTARPSLTPSLTPATNTPAPQPTHPPGPGPQPTDTPLPATPTPMPPTAVVVKNSVNVRSGPGVIYDVIGVARQDERYLITGQFPPGDWLQIDYNGKVGWIYRALVNIEGDAGQIPPITDIPPTPTFTPSPTPTDTPTPTLTPSPIPTQADDTPSPPTPVPPTATPLPPSPTPGPPMAVIVGQNVPIRKGPGLIYDEIGVANQGEEYLITGLSVTGDWFQIDYRGQPGWVFLIQVEPVADIEQIPVIEEIPPTPTFTPAPATPTPVPETTLAPEPTPTVADAGTGEGPPTALLLIGGLITLALIAGVIIYLLRNRPS